MPLLSELGTLKIGQGESQWSIMDQSLMHISLIYIIHLSLTRGIKIFNLHESGYYQYKLLVLSLRHLNLDRGCLNDH